MSRSQAGSRASSVTQFSNHGRPKQSMALLKQGMSRQSVAPSNSQKHTMKDEELLEQLSLFNFSVTLQELQHPKNSPRLIRCVIPELIGLASIIDFKEIDLKVEEVVRARFACPAVHPNMQALILAGITQYFIAMFHPDEKDTYWFTVNDVIHPEPKKIRHVLWILSSIASITTGHEYRLSEYFEAIKKHQDEQSQLWSQDFHLGEMEKQEIRRQQDEAERCAEASDELKRLEFDTSLDAKLADVNAVRDKLFRKRDQDQAILDESSRQIERRIQQVAALDEEIILDGDSLARRLEDCRIERDTLQNELQRKYKISSTNMQFNKKLEEAVLDGEHAGEKLFKVKFEDLANYSKSLEEKRLQRRRSSNTKEKLANARTALEKSRARIQTVKEKLTAKQADITDTVAERARIQSELKRENEVLKEETRKLRIIISQLREEADAVNGETNRLHQECLDLELVNKRRMEEFSNAFAASSADAKAARQAVDQQAAAAEAFLRAKFGVDNSSGKRHRLPKGVREVVDEIRWILEKKEKNGLWIVPKFKWPKDTDSEAPVSAPAS